MSRKKSAVINEQDTFMNSYLLVYANDWLLLQWYHDLGQIYSQSSKQSALRNNK